MWTRKLKHATRLNILTVSEYISKRLIRLGNIKPTTGFRILQWDPSARIWEQKRTKLKWEKHAQDERPFDSLPFALLSEADGQSQDWWTLLKSWEATDANSGQVKLERIGSSDRLIDRSNLMSWS